MNPLDDILAPGQQPDEVSKPPPEAAPNPPQADATPPPTPSPTEKKDPLSDLVPTGTGTAPPAAAPPEQEPVKSWSEVPGVAAKHLVPSAIATGEAMAQPFIHPIQTYENLRDLGHGILQKAGIMSGQEDTGKVDAVMDYFAKRYGGMQQLRDTIGNDPIGFATDAATVLTGGEAALGKIAGTVGRAIEPMALPRAAGRALIPGAGDAAELSKAGVSLTPGQMAGGFGKAAEDMLTSVPFLGSWIKSGRARSIESFNKSVANQVLEPIGETVGRKTEAGHALVSEVGDKLTEAYGQITPKLKFTPDNQYWTEIASIYQNDYPWLSSDMQTKFDNLVGKQMSPPGSPFKTVESTLSSVTNKYLHSADATQRELGEVANKVLIAVRENVARTNPAEATELAKVNRAYAMFTRMRNAAARGEEGVFTPSQLLGAVKAGDKSVGKGSFARGDALMQTFAELGQRVLPSKVPTSGTSERAAMMAAIFGEGYLYSPHIAMGVGAGIAPYTGPGMAATNALFRAGQLGKTPMGYLPRGTSYQLGKMNETEEDAYNRTRRLFPQ